MRRGPFPAERGARRFPWLGAGAVLLLLFALFLSAGGCARGKYGEAGEGRRAAGQAERETPELPASEGQVGAARSESFEVFSPVPGATITSPVRVRGRARVFEGSFILEIEDGHRVLARQVAQASAGAPEWGEFDLSVEFETPTSPGGAIIFVTQAPADGRRREELLLPVRFSEVRRP